MAYIRIKNQPMHAEVSSSDASNGALLTVYESGKFISYDIDTVNEFYVITDVFISAAAGGSVALFCDTSNTPTTVGAGEAIIAATLAANGTIIRHFTTPFICAKGAPLVLKAASGQVDCQVQGYIKSNPNSTTYNVATYDASIED